MRHAIRQFCTWRLAWLLACLAVANGSLCAQETEPSAIGEPAAGPVAAASPAAPSAPPAALSNDAPLPGEALPRMLYLPDEQGRLQAVPGFTLEQLIELFKLKNQVAAQSRPPASNISEIMLTGAADAVRADLRADLLVTVHEAGWVRVPLRMAGAMLREPAVFEGPGEHLLEVADDGSGYVLWIRSEPGATHRVQMRLWVRLNAVGAESHLRMNLPRAPVAELQLEVPLEKAVARASEGSTLESITHAPGGKSMLKVVGISGEFDLGWHAADTPVATLPAVLKAQGEIAIRIDGRIIRSEAKLSVSSSGGEFDHFQVRLPPDAEYVPSAQSAVTVVEGENGERGTVYEVKLAQKTTEPVEVRLLCQRTVPVQVDAPLQLAGFEVIDAVQSGIVTVRVASNWQVQWAEMRHVRQTGDLTGMFDGEDPTSTFEYVMQPFSLAARIGEVETRRRVESDYVIQVNANEAYLHGRIRYTVRGRKVPVLEVDAPGWNVEEIGPDNLVNVNAVIAGQNHPLAIPLLQASAGELAVTFEARHPIMPTDGKIVLPIPVARGESVAAANVTLVPADNVELLIDPEETTDLVSQPARPRSQEPRSPEAPQHQQEPIYFRTAGPAPRLTAAFRVHRQEISIAATTRVAVDEVQSHVDQRLAFQIAYEPTDHLLLGVPRGLPTDLLSVSLDSQRLQTAPVRVGEAASADVMPLRVTLPEARLGRCELRVEYTIAHEPLAGDASTLVEVPLVVPGEGTLSSNTLSVEPQQGVSVTYPKGDWVEDKRKLRPANPAAVHLSAASALPRVGLAVSAKERNPQRATVEQAVIHTRLTDTQRQDRATFRFTTAEPQVRVALPAGVETSSVRIQLDGRRIQGEMHVQGDGRELVLPLTSSASGQHLLELRYLFTDRADRGTVRLHAPQLRPGGWVQQLYWQLELPESEHLLGGPRNYVREFRWVWSNLFWQRWPALGDRELQSWIGTASPIGGAEPPAGDGAGQNLRAPRPANQYLFSTVGTAEPLEIYTLSRARLVLLASLPILLGGLLLIYVPAARHPALLLFAAVLLAAIGLIDPATALLLAQAATLGAVLVVVAMVLARISLRPAGAAPTAPIRGSSQAIERSFTEAFPRASGGSQPSTATNPLVPSTAPESPP